MSLLILKIVSYSSGAIIFLIFNDHLLTTLITSDMREVERLNRDISGLTLAGFLTLDHRYVIISKCHKNLQLKNLNYSSAIQHLSIYHPAMSRTILKTSRSFNNSYCCWLIFRFIWNTLISTMSISLYFHMQLWVFVQDEYGEMYLLALFWLVNGVTT